MNTTDLIQSIGLFLALIGLIWSIISIRSQNKLIIKQMKLSFVVDYTKRYQSIILNFPENINKNNFDFERLSPEVKGKTMRYMRAYFDLCSEEYDLNKNNLIENNVWKNWEKGMSFAFKKQAFKLAWKEIKNDTFFYNNFNSWLESKMKQ